MNKTAFIALFREACQKCFGFPLTSPLTEADSKLFSNKIFESTGLVIGAKSIKNYSSYVLNSNRKEGKENPSTASLDTLARYVLDAPYTDEIMRKEKESHFPFWFQYRNRFSGASRTRTGNGVKSKKVLVICGVTIIAVSVFFMTKFLTHKTSSDFFTDNFNSVSSDSLIKKGWIIKSTDSIWWNKRGEKPGYLTLYTLAGDNWPNSQNRAKINNLLMRKIKSDCFMVETHITDFIPSGSWQQAGILLSEDSTFRGKMVRLSFSYNDFFGGYKKPPEIIIQALSSSESGSQSKPEEFGHLSLFNIEPGEENLVKNNLAISALKIEKKGNHFRFLYALGPTETFAFKEGLSGDFDIQPKYVSIFSIRGWADSINQVPAYFDSFTSVDIPCSK